MVVVNKRAAGARSTSYAYRMSTYLSGVRGYLVLSLADAHSQV